MQASDRTPRSTHWFSDESVTSALLTWYKDKRAEIYSPIYLSLDEHIDLPFPGWTHRFTFPWLNTSIYISQDEYINLPFSWWTHWFTFPLTNTSINISLEEHIDLPFPGWTHRFTFPWMITSIYLSRDESIIATCSTSGHQCQSSQGVETKVKDDRGSIPGTKRTLNNCCIIPGVVYCTKRNESRLFWWFRQYDIRNIIMDMHF